ncbi:response regulator [Hymenobacter mucosus]|uniref:Response regulator receiver domain-containing protein n=1 Tax=Hymenobacter mucosus TaxID=1411120 RepID=A0A239AKK7_9BACT|nr:response regulator [Hymenobacter mucosus]SNR96205.1 Response regulator receiver domain-containing protein [Hymenobacter mucosus]
MPQLSSILLVDDDATTNFLNQALITRMGVVQHTLVAENGAEALQILAQTCVAPSASCPNLILLDMKMPIMNGIEFLEAYTQLPFEQQQSIIIVMLTTSLLSQDLERVQQLPVADVLNKPLTKEKVQGLLEKYF